MHLASITKRLAELGSKKWGTHIRARELAENGKDIIELTIGEPDIPTDDVLLKICSDAMNMGRTKYSNGRGETVLVSAIAEKYTRRSGREVLADNILCLPGTQTALFTSMLGLVESGDRVLVPDPYYATYEGVIRASGAEFTAVPLWYENDFRLRAQDLEAAITPDCRVLLLNNPHNPTGAVLSSAEIATIGEICQQHDLWIISDEVYEELIFDKKFSSPFDNADLAERTIVVSSISKSHAAPGFRSGWIVGPKEVCDALLPISESMLFGCQPFIADMTAHALTHDLPTAQTMRLDYSRRAQIVASQLSDVLSIKPVMPDAGMFMLLNVKFTGLTGDEFANQLLENYHVAVMPGASFGSQGTDFVRISLTVPDEILILACKQIAKFATNQTNVIPVLMQA